jgi:hypothetical protein
MKQLLVLQDSAEYISKNHAKYENYIVMATIPLGKEALCVWFK